MGFFVDWSPINPSAAQVLTGVATPGKWPGKWHEEAGQDASSGARGHVYELVCFSQYFGTTNKIKEVYIGTYESANNTGCYWHLRKFSGPFFSQKNYVPENFRLLLL